MTAYPWEEFDYYADPISGFRGDPGEHNGCFSLILLTVLVIALYFWFK